MPDLKISQLPAATTPLAGTELVPIVQSGTTDKVTVADLTAGRAVSASALTASSGNLSFSGTAQRITGDMSNATQSNRLAFQTNTTNGNSVFYVLPNGTATTSGVIFSANSDPTNASIGFLQSTATDFRVAASITGTGTYLPMTFSAGGSERVRIDTSGNVGIGTGSPVGKLSVNLADASGSTSAWDSTYATFGAAGSTAGKAVGIGFNATSNYGEIRSVQPGVTWTDLYIRGNNLNFYYSLAGASTLGMVLNTSGNVGIGTASPGTRLTVAAAVEAGARFLGNGLTSAGLFVGYNSAAYVYNDSNTPLIFGTNSAERMRITATGNVVAGASAALATNATDGFLYVPTCAGTPTGTPTAITGMAPIVVNTTNNKLYFYSGGAWRDAGP